MLPTDPSWLGFGFESELKIRGIDFLTAVKMQKVDFICQGFSKRENSQTIKLQKFFKWHKKSFLGDIKREMLTKGLLEFFKNEILVCFHIYTEFYIIITLLPKAIYLTKNI